MPMVKESAVTVCGKTEDPSLRASYLCFPLSDSTPDKLGYHLYHWEVSTRMDIASNCKNLVSVFLIYFYDSCVWNKLNDRTK